MTHEDAFLQDVIEQPDSDTPRRIYADWLLDSGDEGRVARGEFIHLQLELDRRAEKDRPAALVARKGDLFEVWHREWDSPLAHKIKDRDVLWLVNQIIARAFRSSSEKENARMVATLVTPRQMQPGGQRRWWYSARDRAALHFGQTAGPGRAVPRPGSVRAARPGAARRGR
jgi:uncharacterized protein (TIGR02996 family)